MEKGNNFVRCLQSSLEPKNIFLYNSFFDDSNKDPYRKIIFSHCPENLLLSLGFWSLILKRKVLNSFKPDILYLNIFNETKKIIEENCYLI